TPLPPLAGNGSVTGRFVTSSTSSPGRASVCESLSTAVGGVWGTFPTSAVYCGSGTADAQLSHQSSDAAFLSPYGCGPLGRCRSGCHGHPQLAGPRKPGHHQSLCPCESGNSTRSSGTPCASC